MEIKKTVPLRLEHLTIEEGNTEFSECYLEIRLFGLKLDSAAGKRAAVVEWVEARREQLYHQLCKHLAVIEEPEEPVEERTDPEPGVCRYHRAGSIKFIGTASCARITCARCDETTRVGVNHTPCHPRWDPDQWPKLIEAIKAFLKSWEAINHRREAMGDLYEG